MATLQSMTNLYADLSTNINKTIQKTTNVTVNILKVSAATNIFNNKLAETGANAETASGGLSKLFDVSSLVSKALKGMSIVDEFTNTNTRLNLINDGLQTQTQLQDKVFASANRSKSAYGDMVNVISGMGSLVGKTFGSNDELVAFAELAQKSFKLGGASPSEQSSAMSQLSQSMATGKLQGGEFESIMTNAPMIADAIAKYTGKSKDELMELSANGGISADILKNAMFMAGNDIDAKFNTMPMTFADIWNRIKNGGIQAFASIMEKVNILINTDSFKMFIEGLIMGFDLLAQTAGWLIDTIINGWDTIGPILGIIGGVLLVAMITQLWAMIPPLIAQAAAWLAVYWPLLLVIVIIGIAISAARQFGASWEEIFGFIGGVIGVFATKFYNDFVYIWNVVAAFINFIGNVFNNPIASIQKLFFDLAANVIGFITTMAKAIEDVINKIPGVKVNITGGLEKFKGKLEAESANIKDKAGLVEYVKAKEFKDYSEGYNNGSIIGKKVPVYLDEALEKLTNPTKDKDKKYDYNPYGTSGKPLTVEGTGKNKKVDVDMDDEDLKYLRDMAERDYINKFSTATLAPNVQFNFGDIKETADINVIKGVLERMIREEISTASEGVY